MRQSACTCQPVFWHASPRVRRKSCRSALSRKMSSRRPHDSARGKPLPDIPPSASTPCRGKFTPRRCVNIKTRPVSVRSREDVPAPSQIRWHRNCIGWRVEFTCDCSLDTSKKRRFGCIRQMIVSLENNLAWRQSLLSFISIHKPQPTSCP